MKATTKPKNGKTGILMRARVCGQAGGAIHERLFELEDEPDKLVPRETALAWWAWAVGTLMSITHQTERLAAEVAKEGSPLFGLFDPELLKTAAASLGDFTMLNAWPLLKVNDPLAGLPRDVV